jgi:hypothetical protein
VRIRATYPRGAEPWLSICITHIINSKISKIGSRLQTLTDTLAMICEHCQKVSLHTIIEGGGCRHQPSLQALQKSSRQGCAFCVHLYESLASNLSKSVNLRDYGEIHLWFTRLPKEDKPLVLQRFGVRCRPWKIDKVPRPTLLGYIYLSTRDG